jgi:hypothetical protein
MSSRPDTFQNNFIPALSLQASNNMSSGRRGIGHLARARAFG